MSRLFISLLIGLVAGVIDVAPMIVLKIGRRDCISAFVHWIVVSVLIAYVQMPVASWLKGIVVAVLSCLPVVISVSEKDPKSIVPILIMSVVLGAAVGFATFKYAN
jgi:hypothetical protein